MHLLIADIILKRMDIILKGAAHFGHVLWTMHDIILLPH